MALMEVNFYSNVLGMNCRVNVIIPQRNQGVGLSGTQKADKYKVLWLLHGASDDDTTWLRRTSIERYVSALGLAVVMPSVHLSMYTNMVHGARYMDYVADELPGVIYKMFPVSDKREDNYIAGQSMGGYGAMKIGLSRPDRYSAIGCFSSGNFVKLGNQKRPDFRRGGADRNETVFGVTDLAKLKGTEHDLFALMETCINRKESKEIEISRIYSVCGTEDFLLQLAREMNEWFEEKKCCDYSYREAPGEHCWDFWDIWIQDFIKWLLP